MALGQPQVLALTINALLEVAHLTIPVTHKSVARGELAIGRDAQISRSRATGIRPVRPAVNLFESVDDIRERVPFTSDDPAFKLNAALNHGIKERTQLVCSEFAASGWRSQDG